MKAPLRSVPTVAMLFAAAFSVTLRSQDFDENWTVTVNGRSATANPDGSFIIANIPVIDQFGPAGPGSPPDSLSDSFMTVTATAVIDGFSQQMVSEPFQIRVGETFQADDLTFMDLPFVPASLDISPSQTVLASGESLQLSVIGTLSDGSLIDATTRARHTTYLSSNPTRATVGPDGLVTARGRGRAYIRAENSGVTAVMLVDVASDTSPIRLSGLLKLPDGTAAAGASIRVEGIDDEATTQPDGAFDLEVDTLLDSTISLVFTLESAGRRFSKSIDLDVAEGLELIDVGSLVLVAEPLEDLFLQRVFEAGGRPFVLDAADLDGDGDQDLAALNQAHTLGVLRNEGDGTFPTLTSQFIGVTPVGVVLADLDGDGDADAAVTFNASSIVAILRNQGDGTLVADPGISFTSPLGIAAGDIDRDGDTDLAVAGDVSVLRNFGDGTFAPRAPLGAGATAIDLADLDVDGNTDIITGVEGFPGSLSTFRNLGDGTFAAKVSYTLDSFQPRIAITASDIDGDDVPEVATTSFNNSSALVLRNRGDGVLLAAVRHTVGTAPSFIATGDLDGDGHVELCVSNSQGPSVSVLPNNGDGTMAAHVAYVAGGSPAGVLLEDFDGDGDRDVAVANNANVQVLRNHGDGALESHYVQYPAGGSSTSVALGDVDGDGDPDVALGGGAVFVQRNTGGGAFGVPTRLGPGLLSPNSVTLADLDGDGDLDLAAADFSPSSNSVSVFQNQGGGTFSAPIQNGVGSQPIHVAAGDLDGDGDADLAAANLVPRTVSILRNRGDATFEPHVTYSVAGQPTAIGIGDFDGDTDMDIAATSQSPDVLSIIRNNGDGTFAGPVTLDAGDFVRPGLGIGDVDGDADTDLVVGLGIARAVSVLRNEGGGTFAPRVEYGSVKDPREIAVKDIDGDGAADIAVVAETSAAISYLRNLGDATFAAPLMFGVMAESWAFAPEDVDGDGDTDFVVGHINASRITVLLNQTIH